MQCAWLSYTTSLINLLVTDKTVKSFNKEHDPKKLGILIEPKKKATNGTPSFLSPPLPKKSLANQ